MRIQTRYSFRVNLFELGPSLFWSNGPGERIYMETEVGPNCLNDLTTKAPMVLDVSAYESPQAALERSTISWLTGILSLAQRARETGELGREIVRA